MPSELDNCKQNCLILCYLKCYCKNVCNYGGGDGGFVQSWIFQWGDVPLQILNLSGRERVRLK